MADNLLHGRYKLISNLGHGSFATVYLSRDTQRRGEMVAIKVISTEGFSPAEYSDLNTQFLQEAAFLMALNHPGLPRVLEFFAEGPCYYIVMEWIAGKTMRQKVTEADRVTQDQVLEWGTALCDVLAYLHAHKPYPIILGDLKPSNVMITYDNRVKIIDFGVARYLSPSKNPRTFALVSPGFSPPEKYTRFDCDLRGDIYSLGATLYWALTQADMVKFKFYVPPLRELRPEANHWLEKFLVKCLQYNPEARFQNIGKARQEILMVRKELQGREERALEKTGNILEQLYKQKYGDDLL